MIIGCFITGMTVEGQPGQGIVLDKIRTIFNMQRKAPGLIGAQQDIPVPLDGYLVLNPETQQTCIISPSHINSVQFVEPQPVAAEEFGSAEDFIRQ